MATQSAAELNAQYEYHEIPLELIDEPAVPERETMEAADLADLAVSIRDQGLIKPLVVKPSGTRWETVAGHRRLLACRMVDYSPVPCRIKANGSVDSLAILVAENAHVEPVNPIEEARFFQRVLEEACDNDVDALCIKLRRKRGYVEDRLIMLRGHPKVIEALQARRISMAVARELNKIPDEARLILLLDVSINQGATARQVETWRREAAQLGPIGAAPDTSAEDNAKAIALIPQFNPECLFCQSSLHHHMMELVYLHKPCKDIVLSVLNRAPAANPEAH
jgi:ParB family chromosome partitioning protein